MSLAAIFAVVLIGIVIVFQILLALGVPWGAAAWGGKHAGVLPLGLRLASAVSAVLLGVMAWLVMQKGARREDDPSWLDPVLWVIASYFLLGAIVNLISRSKVERIWAPVALGTAIAVALVAAS
jgi:hypothetical protein